MATKHAATLVLHPLARRAVSDGPIQNPHPLRWFQYEGGSTSCRMAVYHRLPDEHPHHRLQHPTAWVPPLVWTWEDEG